MAYPLTGLGRQATVALDRLPNLDHAMAFERGNRVDFRRPAHRGRGEQTQRMAIVRHRPCRRRDEITVSLGDDEEIGEFDDPLLQALKLITAPWRQEQQEDI